MPKNRVKSQHYVPRTYLRRFADSDERLWVYDKVLDREFTNTVGNVAQEHLFYDVGEDDPNVPGQKVYPEEQPVEEMFGKIEAKYSPVVDDLIENASSGIAAEHLSYLAEFITGQLLRTREAREADVQLAKRAMWIEMQMTMRNAFPDLDHDNITPLIPQIDETVAHLVSLLNTQTWKAMHQALLSHVWMIGVNSTSMLLHTSDHPVVKRGNPSHQGVSGDGVASRGVEIYLPLSPRHILMIFESSHRHAIVKRHRTAVEIEEGNVVYFNDLQAGMSYRQVFSLDESFEWTRKRVHESPNTADPHRKRVELKGGPFGDYDV